MSGRRVSLVTGGSRGIGLGVVRALLAEGDAVVTCARSPSDDLDALLADHGEDGPLRFVALDISHGEAPKQLVQTALTAFGRVDALVNNAGIARDSMLASQPYDDIAQVIDVNLRAALVVCREASRPMLVQESGSIVNVTSVAGLRGYRGVAAYGATKAGLDAATRALARELGPRGVQVNSVALGFVDTDMSASLEDAERERIIRRTPLGRLATVDDVVPAIVWLASGRARFVTGHTLVVDGGQTA